MMRQLPWWPLYPKCAQVQMPSIMQHILHLDGSPSCHISTHKFMQKQDDQRWLQISAAFQREFLRITSKRLSILPCLKIVPNSYNFPCFHASKEKFQHAVFMGMIWPIWKLPWWPSLEATWTLSNSGKWCQDIKQTVQICNSAVCCSTDITNTSIILYISLSNPILQCTNQDTAGYIQ